MGKRLRDSGMEQMQRAGGMDRGGDRGLPERGGSHLAMEGCPQQRGESIPNGQPGYAGLLDPV